jgi:GAF domain-containing protein
MARDNGVVGFVAATSKPYLCEDATEDPFTGEASPRFRSSLTIPMTLNETTVIGVIHAEQLLPKAFSENDLQLGVIVSQSIAAALDRLDLL